MGHSRPLFRLFSSFLTVQLLKNLAARVIQTRIVGAVGENADHYTTTTAPKAGMVCEKSEFQKVLVSLDYDWSHHWTLVIIQATKEMSLSSCFVAFG